MSNFTMRSVHPYKIGKRIECAEMEQKCNFYMHALCIPQTKHAYELPHHVTSSVRSHFRTGHNSVTTIWTMPVTLIEALFLQLAKVEAFSFIGTVAFVIVVLGRRSNLPMFGMAWPFIRACRYLHVGCNVCRTSWRCGDRYRAYRWVYLSVLSCDLLVKLVSSGTFSVALNVSVQILLF